MELLLLVGKIALQRMRSPNAEILDILSARSVEHHIETVERLNIGNEFYPFLTGDGVLPENLPDFLKYRIVCDYIFAPLGRENTIQLFLSITTSGRSRLSSVYRSSSLVCSGVAVSITTASAC